jgi:cytochrome bd-type quinol oxidase subunit 1
MSDIHFPLTGNSVILAAVILIHVFFAFFAVGGMVMALFSEWMGNRKNDPDHARLSAGLSSFLSDMMKINGVLGVVILVLLIGLWKTFTGFLYSTLFWLFMMEGVFFLLLMVFSVSYHRTRGKISSAAHLLLGAAAAFCAVMAAFLINVAWAFMMAPGKWLETGSRWDAVQSPILWESFIHMLLPCLINAALFIFLYSLWKSRLPGPDTAYFEKINRFSARMAAGLIFLQPLSGLGFLLKVRSVSRGLPIPNPFQQLWTGLGRPFLHVMIALATISVLCAALYWILGHKKGKKALAVAALTMFAAFFTGGYAREKARKPYLVWGSMYMSQQWKASETPLAKESKAPEGHSIYAKSGCGACHSFLGKGGTMGPELADLGGRFSKDDLKAFINEPPEDMPPFSGNEQELDVLATYLLTNS